MESTVVQLLDGASRRFNSWLKQYQPWHGNNDITESNLTFQVAVSFLESFPDGMAFMEVPFAAPDQKRTDRRLDAYLTSPSLALLVEAKIVYAPKHISWIGDDIARMTAHLVSQLHEGCSSSCGPPPSAAHCRQTEARRRGERGGRVSVSGSQLSSRDHHLPAPARRARRPGLGQGGGGDWGLGDLLAKRREITAPAES